MSKTSSSFARVLSGSAAAMVRVGIVFLMQVALVPLYLKHWSAAQFGYWMFFQSVIVLITVPDVGLQAYVEVAYIRQCGQSSRRLSTFLSIGASTGLLLSLVQLALCVLLHASGALHLILQPQDMERVFVDQIGMGLIVTALTWPVASSVSGSMGRASVVQGSVAPQIWWSILTLFCGGSSSAVCAAMGGGLLEAAMAGAVATGLSGLASIFYFRARFRRAGVRLMLAYRFVRAAMIWRASGLMLKVLFETIRQHSLRLIAPQVVSVASMASLSVHRTMVGALQQAFGVVSAPMMPEYVRAQKGSTFSLESASLMRIQWRFFSGVILPGGLTLFVVGPYLFAIWTHGKIAFDASAFSLLLLSVAAYAVFSPFSQYLQAANKVREQAFISGLVLFVSVALVLGLGFYFHLHGLALAFLLIESVQGLLCVWQCRRLCQGERFSAVLRLFSVIAFMAATLLVLPNWLPSNWVPAYCLAAAVMAVVFSFRAQIKSLALHVSTCLVRP